MEIYLVTYRWRADSASKWEYADKVVRGDPIAWLIECKTILKRCGQVAFLLNVERLHSSVHAEALEDLVTD